MNSEKIGGLAAAAFCIAALLCLAKGLGLPLSWKWASSPIWVGLLVWCVYIFGAVALGEIRKWR